MTSIIHTRLDGIRRLVRGETRPAPGHHHAVVIAVCARKGGVGKTTTAVNLAADLAARKGQKVLLIDMDPQGHCGTALESTLKGQAPTSTGELLLGKRRDLQEIARETRIGGLWVTPSDKELGAAESVMAGRIGKEFLLRSALKIARTHYDVIIIDCPPNLGSLTINALVAAQWLLVPCDMSVLALEGVADILETVETLDETLGAAPSVLGVLRTRFDARNQTVNDAVDTVLTERWGHHLVQTRIPVNTRLSQAQAAGLPIHAFDPNCRGAKAYAAVSDELVERLALTH